MKTSFTCLAFAICFGSTVFAAPSPSPDKIVPASSNLRAAQAVDSLACPDIVCPEGQAVFPESELGCECQIVFCPAVVCREDQAPGSTCYCPPLPTSTPTASPQAICIQSICENGSVRDPVTCQCPCNLPVPNPGLHPISLPRRNSPQPPNLPLQFCITVQHSLSTFGTGESLA